MAASELYFAYGINMGTRERQRMCPHAKFIGNAMLTDYRIVFHTYESKWAGGILSIVPAPNMTVWGALFAIEHHCKIKLDIGMGHGTAYVRTPVRVTQPEDGRSVVAFTYRMIRRQLLETPPQEAYMHALTEGAIEVGLPLAYREFLFALWEESEREHFRRGLLVVPGDITHGIRLNPGNLLDPQARLTLRCRQYTDQATPTYDRSLPLGVCHLGGDVCQQLNLNASAHFGVVVRVE